MKKALSLFLAVIMVILSVPMAAAAASEETGNISASSADVVLSGTNSVGNMLAAELEEAAAQTESTGNVIYSVEIEQDTDSCIAFVELSTAVSCTLFVGVYTEDQKTLLSSGSALVTPEDEYADVTLSDSVPDYFYIKAFLVDTEDFSPLSSAYDSPLYTQEMQEFLEKTTDDFAEDKVVNFDDDTTNNFAVLADDVLTLDESSQTNVITFADTESNIYIIENIDASVSSLKAGDTFSGVYDGDTVIVKIGEISVDGTTATILGTDAELDEIFDYVKLDAVTGITDGAVDPESCGEGVTFEGYESDAETYATSIEGSRMADAKFSFEFTKKGNDSLNVTVAGNIKLKMVFAPKLYISTNYKYLELKFDYSIGGSVSVTGKFEHEIPIAALTLGIPCVRTEIAFKFLFSASGSIEVSGTLLKGTLGYGWYSDVGGVSLCSTPKAEFEVNAEVTIFIGLRIEPKISILEGVLAEASIQSDVGAELKATLSENTSDWFSTSKKHDCKACVKGEVYGKFDLSVKGKLLKNKKWSLSFKLLEAKAKISDFYWSITRGEFGFTTCPHIVYKLTVAVFDKYGKTIENAVVTVNGETYSTDENGTVAVFLPNGSYQVTAAKDYLNSQKNVVIKDNGKALELKLEKAVISDTQTLSLGNNHSATITKSGDLYLCGRNNHGQLGDGTTTDRYSPKKIMSNVASVSLGFENSAAITKSGDLYLWGVNLDGQLGDGTTTDRYSPKKIMSNVASVSLGFSHSAAITKTGDLYLWGWNYHGQLGDGTRTNSYTPKKILSNVASVSLGEEHSAAITKSGDLYLWGDNYFGQLGDGTATKRYSPKKIMSNVASVSLGGCHSAAITKTGDLYLWGVNSYGQLGDGTTTDRYSPKKIMSNAVSVSLGGVHSAAITQTGDLYLWGWNNYGQLGDGTATHRYSPKKIMSNVASVSLGYIHSAAVTKSGALYLWGFNYFGELGDGTTTDRCSPTKITLPGNSAVAYSLFSARPLSETSGVSSFESLVPNTVYNFYIMKDRMAEDAFSRNNLIYINQGKTDENGSITFEYDESGTDFAAAERFVAEFKNVLPDAAIGDTDLKSSGGQICFDVHNANLGGYDNVFARFTVDDESFDVTEFTEIENGMRFVCDIAPGLPASTEIKVQLFASYAGVQYQSKANECLLIDATNGPDGGYCGETLYWSLDTDSGVLTVFGDGDMFDYDATSSYAPWTAQRDTIKSVIIEDGVTRIGSNAFWDCANIADVYYAGSREDWNNISTDSDNSELANANIHCNVTDSESHYEYTVITEPGCTTDGKAQYTCPCGYTREEVIPALDHTYEDGVCTICGKRDPNAVILGDANGDGVVNAVDSTLISRKLSGWTVDIDSVAADVNGDGLVDAKDVTLINRKLSGWSVDS